MHTIKLKNGATRRVYSKQENKRMGLLPDAISPYHACFNTKISDTRKSMKLRSGTIRAKKAKSVIHQRIEYKG